MRVTDLPESIDGFVQPGLTSRPEREDGHERGVDLSGAVRLPENRGIAFIGDQPTGPFEVDSDTALIWLRLPRNPNGRPNSDVVRPFMTGGDLLQKRASTWIVDFPAGTSLEAAALYEAPFAHVEQKVKPFRAKSRTLAARDSWWKHWRPRPEMRAQLEKVDRYIATTIHAKHRVFVWLDVSVLADHGVVAIARADDYFFGVLHSRAHELWSLRMGTWLGKGNDPRYTPTTCFETFPLPWPPGQEPWRDERLHAIANAARDLDQKRRNWLDPEGATEAELKKRTLTNLYNERPAWLDHAHAALDRAVWAAYGWDDPEPASVPEDVILSRLLALNQARRDRNSG